MPVTAGQIDSNSMMHPCSIRPLRLEDAPAIEALYAACMAVEPGIGPVTAQDWSRTIALPQFRGGRDFLVVERDGCLVALAESSPRGDDLRRVRHLKLVVDPAHRRRGLATALLRAVMDQDAGGAPVTVQGNVPSRWAAGMAFLARHGFARVESEVVMRSEGPLPTVAALAGVALIRMAASEVDAARVAAIHNAAFRDDAGFAWQTPVDARRHVEAGHLWVARLAGELVGYALVEPEAGLAWLETVAVDPACRGRGIGTALIIEALRGGGVGKGRAAGLGVSSRNGAAMRLYGRLGFVQTSEKGKYAASRGDLLARLSASPQGRSPAMA